MLALSVNNPIWTVYDMNKGRDSALDAVNISEHFGIYVFLQMLSNATRTERTCYVLELF